MGTIDDKIEGSLAASITSLKHYSSQAPQFVSILTLLE